MLVRHDVVFVFGVGRLVLGGHVDGFVGEVRGAVEFLMGKGLVVGKGGDVDGRWEVGDTYLEEVSMTGLVEVDVGV